MQGPLTMRLPTDIERCLETAKDLDDALRALTGLLSGGYSVWVDGTLIFTRELVARVHGLKLYVYANDHPPPHFHILGSGFDASFAIDDCRCLRGNIPPRQYALIKWWYLRSKPLLIAAWERLSPETTRTS